MRNSHRVLVKAEPRVARRKIRIEIERQGELNAWWVKWIEDGRVRWESSERCQSIGQAREVAAVMRRAAHCAMACSCGRRSEVETDHSLVCAVRTARRMLARFEPAIRRWTESVALRYIRGCYETYVTRMRGRQMVVEPELTLDDVCSAITAEDGEHAMVLRVMAKPKRETYVRDILQALELKRRIRVEEVKGRTYYSPVLG